MNVHPGRVHDDEFQWIFFGVRAHASWYKININLIYNHTLLLHCP